jgi:Helicase conserved C-terminal domain
MEFDTNGWSERAAAALEHYDEDLLRGVAARLIRPRNQWPVEELRNRLVEGLSNAPVVDRRLKELPSVVRFWLAVAARLRCHRWHAYDLVHLANRLGAPEQMANVFTLLDSGLAIPVLATPPAKPLRTWDDWLAHSGTTPEIEIPPTVAARASFDDAHFPAITGKTFEPKHISRNDGLEWLLRTGLLWQQVFEGPMRVTQTGMPFKRDLVRLGSDEILSAPLPETRGTIPELGLLALDLSRRIGLLTLTDNELRAGEFRFGEPNEAFAFQRSVLRHLPKFKLWDPVAGVRTEANPVPFAMILLLTTLSRQPGDDWFHPDDLAKNFRLTEIGISEDAVANLLFALGIPLRLVESCEDGEGYWFRATPLLRHLLAEGPVPAEGETFPQCLIVQPNSDVIAYRQGLTPDLIVKLTAFADWKMIGPACTLALTAESVYRGLEAGFSLNDLLGTLRKHSAQELPANVVDMIRRWSAKRERINVYPSATLLEFNTPADLEEAFSRALVSMKISDRIGLVEGEVDYRHYRLLGNRDYESRPMQCVAFENDGITFTVDITGSDLLLEAELLRLAERLPDEQGERCYRLTPASIAKAKETGVQLTELEQWYLSRSGEPLSASARLLFVGSAGMSGSVSRFVVVQFPNSMVADGVCQWPDSAAYVVQRLGPATIAIDESRLPELIRTLAAVNVTVTMGPPEES